MVASVRSPKPGYFNPTAGTTVVPDPVDSDHKPESINKQFTAPMTKGLFSLMTGQIAGINVFQPCFMADLLGRLDHLDGGRRSIRKAIGRMKAADVPWCTRIEISDKSCEISEFFLRVILSRYE